MRQAFIFLVIVLIGVSFEVSAYFEKFWPGYYRFFLTNDYEMLVRSYVYYIAEHVTIIILATWVYRATLNRVALIYVVVEWGDLGDFIVTGNTVWFHSGELPVTYNVIKVLIFVLVICHELINRIISDRHT